MYKCKYIQPIQPQVKFGVALKEVYPPWYLHPALKNIMYLAEINIRNRSSTRFDVEEILSNRLNGEGSLKQRLHLKDVMTSGKNLLDVPITPGAPIWVIRHFLGLLPTPIFAPKSEYNYWFNFSMRYYEEMIVSVKTRKSSEELKYTIAFEIAHLPARNLTFLFEFFDLLRFLSSKTVTDCTEVLDKNAALLVVRYFVPSLFVRPYKPGMLTKADKKYVALVLYIVYFWPYLRVKIHDMLISSINKYETKFHYFPEHYYDSKYSDNNDYLKDVGIQTQTSEEINSCLSFASNSSLSSVMFLNIKETIENHMADSDYNIYKNNNFEEAETVVPTNEKSKENIKKKILFSTPYEEKQCNNTSEKFNVLLNKKDTESQTSINSWKNADKKKSQRSLSTKSSRNKIVSSKVRKRVKHKKDFDIIILEIPYKIRRIRTRNIKIITFKKYWLKSQQYRYKKDNSTPPRKKLNLKDNKTSPVDRKDKENFQPVTQVNKNSSVVNPSKYDLSANMTVNSEEYIYDPFIGNCLSEEKSSINPFKNLTPLSSSYIDFNSPVRSVDLYDKITKYGWTYNSSNKKPNSSSKNSPILDPYKICFDNEDINTSRGTNTSLLPLTKTTTSDNTEKRSNTSFLKSLKNVTSKFNFFKSNLTKTPSVENLKSSVKYKRILKATKSV